MDKIDISANQSELDPFGFEKFNALQAGMKFFAIDDEISDLQKQLENLQDQYNALRRHILPARMEDETRSEITIGNRRIELERSVEASLPKEDLAKRRQILDLLLKLGHGGVIKRELTLELPKGDRVAEHKAIDALREALPELTPEVDENIHTSTYKALVKRLLEAGEDGLKE